MGIIVKNRSKSASVSTKKGKLHSDNSAVKDYWKNRDTGFKKLTIEQVEANRSKAYDYVL